MASTVEKLRELGYMYNKEGRLVKVSNPSEGFTFEGQEHYNKLGDIVFEEIQRQMREDLGLVEHWLPTDTDESRSRGCNVFTTPAILTSQAPLLVLICGTGAVMAGQWARSLCINNSLDEGSALPEIRMALRRGWNVLVMNNNKPMGTPGDSSNARALCAWDHFVRPSRARAIAVLAHSYGGINTCCIIARELEHGGRRDVLNRIACIAFTDSVHSPPEGPSKQWFTKCLGKRARNWVQSRDPLDTPEDAWDCITRVSAGHPKHEFTTCSARPSVHKFIDANMITHLTKMRAKRVRAENAKKAHKNKQQQHHHHHYYQKCTKKKHN